MLSRLRYKRTHSGGIEASIREEPLSWRIAIDYRQQDKPPFSLVGLHAPTLQDAKEFADTLVRDKDHVCDAYCCREWKRF
jgi:hypothetical protein